MNITDFKSISKSGYKSYLEKGISYDQYKYQMAEDFLHNSDDKIKEYINLNKHRMSRIEKTYTVSQKIEQALKRLNHKTHWLVLTEHWCGDAAQTLPAFQKVAELSNGSIELKFVYSDGNPQLMDAYLTGTSRSIPKLIQLDRYYNVTGIWGPRPVEAQKLVNQLKSNPEKASSYTIELHKWYARDKQKALEIEIIELINRAALFCTDCLN